MKRLILNGTSLFLLMFAFLIPIQSATAQVDVTCKGSACLVVGWDSFKIPTGELDQSYCLSFDCSNVGWREFKADGNIFETSCMPGGCFTEGYTIVDLVGGGVVVGEVSCMANECHRIGWVEKSEGQVYITLCKNQDCRSNGWTTRWRNFITTDTTCKSGGCFVSGWIEQ